MSALEQSYQSLQTQFGVMNTEMSGLRQQVGALSQQYTEVYAKVAVVESKVGGVVDQVTHLHEASAKRHLETQTLITNSVAEVQKSVDVILRVFSLDEGPDTAKELKATIQYATESREAEKKNRSLREKLMIVIYTAIALSALTFVGRILWLGSSAWFADTATEYQSRQKE